MSKKEAKLIYETMLASGELLELFPDLTGDWSKDKKHFMSQYDLNEDFLQSGMDLDFDNFID